MEIDQFQDTLTMKFKYNVYIIPTVKEDTSNIQPSNDQKNDV